MRRRKKEGGFAEWNVYNDLQNSSTRCEIGAALMGMQPKVEANIGVDNAATVGIGNRIINHQIDRLNAKLYEEDEAMRLGGKISKLHRESPFNQICALMKNGDKRVLGPLLTKVKGPATQKMVDEGEVPAEQEYGNDGADEVADKRN